MDRENRTLLIVDGSTSYRFYLGTMLSRLEYSVHGAESAEDAVKLIATILPSLIISDLASGIVLLSRMRQDKRVRTVPVIIQSADDGPEIREKCMLAGCIEYFKKPAAIDELYRAIQSGLETSPRRTVRIETDFKVIVGDRKAPRGHVMQGSISELSEGGLYIRTHSPHPVKAVVPLTMFIEDREIHATAVVLYVSRKTDGPHQKPGMGMKFVTIDDNDRVLIRDYIRKRISQGLSL